jgi:hypothetical protein
MAGAIMLPENWYFFSGMLGAIMFCRVREMEAIIVDKINR